MSDDTQSKQPMEPALESVRVDSRTIVKKPPDEPAFLLKKRDYFICRESNVDAAEEKNKAYAWLGAFLTSLIGVAGFTTVPPEIFQSTKANFFPRPLLTLVIMCVICLVSLVEGLGVPPCTKG